MGHNIEHFSYPAGKKKSVIEAELNERVSHITWREGHGHGLSSQIRFLDRVLPDYNSARTYLKEQDKGWYDQLAVKYKQMPEGKTSAKLQSLREKLSVLNKEYQALNATIVAQSFKADFVGCKQCGSKINRNYIQSNFCPICHTDMRSETIQKKLANMKAKIDKLNQEIKAEELRLTEKFAEIYWLVKIEYHT